MKIKQNPKIAIAGSVNSSLRTLKKMYEHNCDVRLVLGLDPGRSKNVSGYCDIKLEAEKLGLNSCYFSNINDPKVYEVLQTEEIDLLFVIGLSQMVKEPLLSLAKIGNVGFHPTKLPQGRGRGAVAWIVLGKAPGAATFFLLDEGMDSGPILGQKDFEVNDTDEASDVIEKIKFGIDNVLDEVLPKLKMGELELMAQDHKKATFLGVRKPQDGAINWKKSSWDVRSLVQATSHPLPGAFSSYLGQKVIVWKVTECPQYCGIPGRIIDIVDGSPIVCCGEGAVKLISLTKPDDLNYKIGQEFN